MLSCTVLTLNRIHVGIIDLNHDYLMMNSALLQIAGDFDDAEISVTQLISHEALSNNNNIRISLLSNRALQRPSTLIGNNVSLTLTHQNKSEVFNGLIASIQQGSQSFNSLFSYEIMLLPWTAWLEDDINFRTFHNMSVTEIITKVFPQHNCYNYDLTHLQEKYRSRSYCTQYNESTWHFISRLMEEEGIYYYFKHENNKHTLVLSDNTQSYTAYPNSIYQANQFTPTEDHIYDWYEKEQIIPNQVTLADYFFQTPNTRLIAQNSQKDPPLQLNFFHYPGSFKTLADGTKRTNLWQELFLSQKKKAQGKSQCMGLHAGTRFQISNQTHESLYVISSIKHIATDHSDKTFANTLTENTQQHYHNQFQCIPATQLFRPKRAHAKQIIINTQTANVGSTAKITRDKYGGSKTQLHWMSPNENSTCVRTNQYWSGAEWGSQFLAQNQHEALVSFLNGDPDEPLILSQIYNGSHHTPYVLPQHTLNSGMKIALDEEKNKDCYNELNFNDQIKTASINVRAQKNLTCNVKNNSMININKDLSLNINSGQKHTVKKGASNIQAKTILIKSQATKIHLSAQGITFNSAKIHLLAQGETTSNGVARKNDSHSCPKQTDNNQPHQGGPILKGSSNVLINNAPAARVKDVSHCEQQQDQIKTGAPHILVNNKPLARAQDETVHGGKIESGSHNVLTGNHPELSIHTLPAVDQNFIIVEIAIIDMPNLDNFVNGILTLYSTNYPTQTENIQNLQVLFSSIKIEQMQAVNEISIDYK